VRSKCIVVVDPFGNGTVGVAQPEEEAIVQQLVAHAAVEGFDIAVLRRLPRHGVVPFDPVFLRQAGSRSR